MKRDIYNLLVIKDSPEDFLLLDSYLYEQLNSLIISEQVLIDGILFLCQSALIIVLTGYR